MPDRDYNRRHLLIERPGTPEGFTVPKKGGSKKVKPASNREAQYRKVAGEFNVALDRGKAKLPDKTIEYAGTPGFYIDFETKADAFDPTRFDTPSQKLDLVMARQTAENTVKATVFIPTVKIPNINRKLERYRTEERNGKPKNQPYVDSISSVALASSRSIWTDDPDRYPKASEMIWWEIWTRKDRSANFVSTAQRLELSLAERKLEFPLVDVYRARATREQLDRVLSFSDSLSELRAGANDIAPLMDLAQAQLLETVDDLARRLHEPNSDVAVCILDTGVMRGHPLIERSLDAADVQQVRGSNSGDWHGHGTAMAGLALLGDVALALHNDDVPSHRLESVQLLTSDLDFQVRADRAPEHLGMVVSQASNLAEIRQPQRMRVFSLATNLNNTGFQNGRPTASSAAIDQLASDPLHRRLFCISMGNVDILPRVATDYIDINDANSGRDPAQSWNALTIGAYTEHHQPSTKRFAAWRGVAPRGDLSPLSRTSIGWDRQWPNKPDVLFEGGNLALEPQARNPHPQRIADFSSVTCDSRHPTPSLRYFGATSGATALASRFCALLMERYPDFWPETIRGLVVHSANLTSAMEARVDRTFTSAHALRRYGYGVPDLTTALHSASDDFTIIFQGDITPFHLDDTTIKTNEMILHELPWPEEALVRLQESRLHLRVTLSYFIQPSPGERGYDKRYRYASHGLRFNLIGQNESKDHFRSRINKQAQDETYHRSRISRDRWKFGEEARNVGSIHSDELDLTAVELATRRYIAVTPTATGWWRDIKSLNQYDNLARYALVVSVRFAEATPIDMYSLVETEVKKLVDIET